MNMNQTQTILNFFNKEAPSLGLTLENLQNPTSDDVIKAYYFICDLIFDLERHRIENEFCDPKLRSEQSGRPMMVLYLANILKNFFQDLFHGQNDFGYSDLLMPDVKRVRYFLFTLIRYYNFKSERQSQINQMDEDLDSNQREVESVRIFVGTTNINLEKLREQLKQLENHRTELSTREMSLKKELGQQKAIMEKVKADNEHVSKVCTEKGAKNEELKLKLSEANDNSDRLNMNIVSSPDRIISEIQKENIQLLDYNQRLAQATQDHRKLERDLQTQQLNAQSLRLLYSDMKKIEKTQDHLSELKRNENDRHKSLGETESRSKALKQEMLDMDTKNSAEVRKMIDQIEQNEKKCNLLMQEKICNQREINELNKRIAKAKEEAQKWRVKISRQNYAFEDLNDDFDIAVEKIKTNYKNAEEKINGFEQDLAACSKKKSALSSKSSLCLSRKHQNHSHLIVESLALTKKRIQTQIIQFYLLFYIVLT